MPVSLFSTASHFISTNWSVLKEHTNLKFISNQQKIQLIALTALTILVSATCYIFYIKIKRMIFTPLSQPHHMIFLDINGTIQLGDSKKQRQDYLLLLALAKTTHAHWGSETEMMSYEEYVKKQIPGDKSNTEIKKAREEMIGKLLEELENNSESNSESVSAKKEALEKYHEVIRQFTDSVGNLNLTIFPSFYKLLDKMIEMKYKFTIILRSFGDDLNPTIKLIENRNQSIKFTQKGYFKGRAFTVQINRTTEQINGTTEKTLNTTKDIFNFFKNSTEHIAVQDDWKTWNENKEKEEYGKLIPVDPSLLLNQTCRIFAFDDNYQGGAEQDILSIRDLNRQKISEGNLRKLANISPNPLVLKAVNPIEAALDPDYFVRLVMG